MNAAGLSPYPRGYTAEGGSPNEESEAHRKLAVGHTLDGMFAIDFRKHRRARDHRHATARTRQFMGRRTSSSVRDAFGVAR